MARDRRCFPVIAVVIATSLGIFAPATRALADPAGEAAAAVPQNSASASPGVGLKRLLTLPKSDSYQEKRYGGLSRSEWRSRFSEADDEIVKTKKDLAETQQKLDEKANSSGNWQVAPPGAQAADGGTNSYQLVQQLRRQRDEAQAAERKKRGLVIEANLAGVPQGWYQAEKAFD